MAIEPLTRRSVVNGCVLAGVVGACGFVAARNSQAAKAKPASAAANGYGAVPTGTGRRLAGLSQIPVGGGVVLSSAGIVLTRVSQDDVHGFSATCTHQGCTVGSVQDGHILCPCHGSVFDASSGAVVAGPAPRPLPKVAVVVRGDAVYTA
jgi:Rieske Fe-S protein